MTIENYIPQLVRAALDNDLRTIRALSMKLIRKIKTENPQIAEEIAKALNFSSIGMDSKRSVGLDSSPLDNDSKLNLLRVEEPNVITKPVFNDKLISVIDEFIEERMNSEKILSAGLNPVSTMLIYGPPGVGKTYLARYLSGELNMKFASLDLASAMSSYLGKTGQNLKQVLDYARREPTLLLLDEFDAIAKKRDDMSDLGELKRIVNVLLKELEDWPSHSIIIAATNHPELLDKAIWRRFDVVIEAPMPSKNERDIIINSYFNNQLPKEKKHDIISIISQLTENISSADICKLCESALRKHLVFGKDIIFVIVNELTKYYNGDDVEFNKKFCKLARQNSTFTLDAIAELLGKSKSTIQYYLKDKEAN